MYRVPPEVLAARPADDGRALGHARLTAVPDQHRLAAVRRGDARR